MRVEQIFTNSPLRNFSYLVYSEDGERVFCIDPWDGGQIIDLLKKRGLKLNSIINTHEHSDHIRGNQELRDYYGARIYAHERAVGLIADLDRPLQAKERLELEAGAWLEALDTPGHTFAHLSLLLYREQKATSVFSGDSFFNAGVGNCSSGSAEALYQSTMQYYDAFADHISLYPGHEYMSNNLQFTLRYEPTNRQAERVKEDYRKATSDGKYVVSTIGLERDINLFLRLNSKELRQELQRHFAEINEESSDREVFLRLRQLRDRW